MHSKIECLYHLRRRPCLLRLNAQCSVQNSIVFMLCANHKVKGWFSTHVETLPTWNHTCAVQLSLLPYMDKIHYLIWHYYWRRLGHVDLVSITAIDLCRTPHTLYNQIREFVIEQMNVVVMHFLQQHRMFRSSDLPQLQWYSELIGLYKYS